MKFISARKQTFLVEQRRRDESKAREKGSRKEDNEEGVGKTDGDCHQLKEDIWRVASRGAYGQAGKLPASRAAGPALKATRSLHT